MDLKPPLPLPKQVRILMAHHHSLPLGLLICRLSYSTVIIISLSSFIALDRSSYSWCASFYCRLLQVGILLLRDFGFDFSKLGMASKEIRSPDSLPERSHAEVAEDGSVQAARRKKLGMHFLESDERRFPAAISGGYVGGTTPVTLRGKPIEDLSKTGGWVAAFFIFGSYPIFVVYINQLKLSFCC
ncbi:putative peptide/nitrate transporter [Dendrobium catenatum]|uniref:Putative peptide/nitrate transporter n=1 Tax=Dendrobium catenatum TaxID=906689 RepID=A0A2I0V6Y9_9ASPA|nr:putative peptide/nitrate transporter [Dendrobium catenatum]